MRSIEDIVLGNDQRGIAALRPHLPSDFCGRAARFVLSSPGRILIVTGFYISRAGAPETDGPPGALALGRALESLGRDVVYVSDLYTTPMLLPFMGSPTQVVDFPITDDHTSGRFATRLLTRLAPSLLISIERCGTTKGRRIPEHAGRQEHNGSHGQDRPPIFAASSHHRNRRWRQRDRYGQPGPVHPKRDLFVKTPRQPGARWG